MGASNLALDSILISPKPGMDLKQGVPGNVGSKVDPKSSKDFDQLLMRQADKKSTHEIVTEVSKSSKPSKNSDAGKAAKAKDGVKASEDSENPQPSSIKEEVAESSATETPAEPVEVQTPDESDATDGDDQIVMAQDGLMAQLQMILENEKNSAKSIEDVTLKVVAKADGVAELPSQFQNIALVQQSKAVELKPSADVLKKPGEQGSEKIEKAQSNDNPASLLEALSAPEKVEAHSNPLEELQIQDALGSKAGLPEMSAPKGKSLKELVDTLYVQQNLGAVTNESSNQSLTSTKVNVLVNSATPETVRTNLVNDIQPVIHDMVMKDKGGEMTVSLRPAHLGYVKVNVQVDDGAVKIALVTETPQAKSMLEGQMKDLHQSLKQSGLKVEEVSVAINPSASSSKGSETSNEQNPQNSQRDSDHSRRETAEHRQPAPQQRHKEELFAEMMKERNAA